MKRGGGGGAPCRLGAGGRTLANSPLLLEGEVLVALACGASGCASSGAATDADQEATVLTEPSTDAWGRLELPCGRGRGRRAGAIPAGPCATAQASAQASDGS